MKYIFYIYLLLTLMFASGCAEKRNLVYFNDIAENANFHEAITKTHEPRIQVGDILSITVSSLDPASNALFNTGSIVQGSVVGASGVTNIGKEGYLVGTDQMINFPIVGQVKLTGLTITEAHEHMRQELLKYVKDPIVNIRYLNFKITVVGEVNKPASFNVPTDKINIIEALGLAGDMTEFGKRENVLVIREVDGTRYMQRLDLSHSSAFNSPYFYLQQNDIVYVEPDVVKEKYASTGPNAVTLPVVLSIITVLTLVYTRFF